MDTVENAEDVQSDESEYEEIAHTAAEVLELMEEAWLNEKFAPEILPHKYDIVECLLGQISHVEENLTNVGNDDLRRSLHQMELDRLRYLVSSYLRMRLEKIETYVYFILKQEEERSQKGEENYLNKNELEFAKAYMQSLDQHFTDRLHFWPGNIPTEWKNQLIIPNIHSFVFMKAKNEIEGVMVSHVNEEEEVVDLRTGSQILISYSNVGHFIKTNQSCLI
ncbi:hypothetical protein PPYR_09121 [Photinus pyralis]|uniref:DNA replication complex GINS protein SLD5 n=2 Tax=Photinus pyralis TaxID=7054 RepID=A0A5N4ALN4_PHOPY|nr:DNA replication complex GINS protein SLD5 [Photinus pyralis]KAB0798128.1 hypothetical protein PPYR_09121 [Photinus pyralis]